MTGQPGALCLTTVSANKYWRHNGQTEHRSMQFKACMNYSWLLTGVWWGDAQLGELKDLHEEGCIVKPGLYVNEPQGRLIRAWTEGNIIHLMKKAVMCENSAAAVSTQRQHSYGLCLEGKVAKWSETYTVYLCECCVDKLLSWSFQNRKLGALVSWFALKQATLLWEWFGDGAILLFWALTSRAEETMTALWWGVNSSTWCCFPPSPGIQH